MDVLRARLHSLASNPRKLRAAASSLGAKLLALLLAAIATMGTGTRWWQNWPVPVGGESVLVPAVTLSAFAVTCAAFVYVRISADRDLWSYEWSFWEFVLGLVSGLLSVAVGILLSPFVSLHFHFMEFVQANRSLTTPLLAVLIAALVFGEPATTYWTKTRCLRVARTTKQWADRLRPFCDEHLGGLLPDVNVQFPLQVRFEPEEVQAPLPIGEATTARLPAILARTGSQLLILAGPGGGKSTQLYLQTARMLDDLEATFAEIQKLYRSSSLRDVQACEQNLRRLPVVINVSIVGDSFERSFPQPFEVWLAQSLGKIYGIGGRIAKEWITTGRVLPMLDGLDALSASGRRQCVTMLKEYLEARPREPVVICCRTAESVDVSGALPALPKATLRPLTPHEIAAQLDELPSAVPLARDVPADPTRETALSAPLAVGLAVAAGESERLEPLPTAAGNDVDRYYAPLCRGYTERRLAEYAPGQTAQTEKMLAWLGYQLRAHHKLVFYLEDLQPDWLPSAASRRWYRILLLAARALIGLPLGVFFGLSIAYVIIRAINFNHGVAVRAILGPGNGTGAIAKLAVAAGVLGGVGIGLIIGEALTNERVSLFSHVRPRREDYWQVFLAAGIVGVLVALVSQLWSTTPGSLIGSLALAAGVGVLVTAFIWWSGGLPRAADRFPPRPNKGLARAFMTAVQIVIGFLAASLVVSGSILLLVGISTLWAINGLAVVLPILLIGVGVMALSVEVLVGLPIALSQGGAAAIRHLIARRTLKRSRVVPPHLVRALERARSARILRREGGGYTFLTHSMVLRDVFAREYDDRYASEYARLTPARSPRAWIMAHLARLPRPHLPQHVRTRPRPAREKSKRGAITINEPQE